MQNEENVYKDDYLEIHDNILKFNNHVIQLANISSISISKKPRKKIPQFLFFALLIGILCFDGHIFLALILTCSSGAAIFSIVNANLNRGYYLKLGLNSHECFYFNAPEKNFFNEIVKVLENCFNHSSQNLIIDLKNSTIQNMQVGDQNTIG